MKTKIISACIGGMLLIIVLALLYTGILRFNYPGKREFPIRGIDISHHQKKIDWEKLRSEEIHFVFMKATEGGDWKDPLFLENWQQAEQAGFVRGAYHFFTFCRSGKDQARNFIETVPNEPITLPPVIDLEFGGNCQARPSKQTILQELKDYIYEVEQVYQAAPMIYVTDAAYETYISGEFEQNAIWIRDIFKRPDLPDGRTWTFWQYSNRGRLDGIETPVDLNVFRGDAAVFRHLLSK